jgi:hypothetical protein
MRKHGEACVAATSYLSDDNVPSPRRGTPFGSGTLIVDYQEETDEHN